MHSHKGWFDHRSYDQTTLTRIQNKLEDYDIC